MKPMKSLESWELTVFQSFLYLESIKIILRRVWGGAAARCQRFQNPVDARSLNSLTIKQKYTSIYENRMKIYECLEARSRPIFPVLEIHENHARESLVGSRSSLPEAAK